MAYVQAIARAYTHYGKDPAGALQAARITPQELPRADARVTAAQFEALSSHAMQELDDEALGWFSRRLPWGSYGLLCRASLASPNLEVALKRWCRHHRLLTEDIGLVLEVTGGLATLRLREHRPLDPACREFCLVTLLRVVHGYMCWAVDSRIALRMAAFPFAAPPHQDAYAAMFRPGAVFDAPQACIGFDARYLSLPIQRDERALRAMLKRALPLTILQYRRDRLLGQRVRELLRADAAATAHALATQLHVSVRTLHRQLHEEGLSLQGLKNAVRHDLAVEQLRHGKRPIKQVARMAGFRSEKSFARAFSQWTGQAPSDFRAGKT